MTKPCEKCNEPGLIDGCCYDHAKLCLGCKENPAHYDTYICSDCAKKDNIDYSIITDTKKALYGYCPQCGAKGVTRERRPNGNDTCENGHTYPSKDSLNETQWIICCNNWVSIKKGIITQCPKCQNLYTTDERMPHLVKTRPFDRKDESNWDDLGHLCRHGIPVSRKCRRCDKVWQSTI